MIMNTLYTEKDELRKRVLAVKKVLPSHKWVRELRTIRPGKYATSEDIKRVQNMLNFKILDLGILDDLEVLATSFTDSDNQKAA